MREITGCYVRAAVCSQCEWFEQPLLVAALGRFPMPPRSICPECGGELRVSTGRYLIKEYLGFFGQVKRTEYLGFLRGRA